jgi:hypothetical protein
MTTSETSDRRRADQSVAVRFTRLMKASTSRYGVLTDPPIVAVCTAVLLMGMLGARQLGAPGPVVILLEAVTVLPLAAAAILTMALSGARDRVVGWLAAVPFPVENMNAVLNGLGEALEIQFQGEPPTSEALNLELDKLNPDCFVTQSAPEEKRVEVRIGVVDSKRNPAVTNHQRFERVRDLVEKVLVPLSKTHPIVDVRVK